MHLPFFVKITDMNRSILIAQLTLLSLRRDKAFLAILAVSLAFFIFVVPAVSSLSLRQVREVAISMALSGVSFVSVILSVVFGINILYRDIERNIYNMLFHCLFPAKVI